MRQPRLRTVLTGAGAALALIGTSTAAYAVTAGPIERSGVIHMALNDAADWFERGHAPYEAALAKIELGRVLGVAGRPEDSSRERARGQQRLRELRTLGRGSGVLSAREIEVLQLVAAGLSNQQIADRLVLSAHTVHRHVSNIMSKVDASSRAAAVANASFLGLLR